MAAVCSGNRIRLANRAGATTREALVCVSGDPHHRRAQSMNRFGQSPRHWRLWAWTSACAQSSRPVSGASPRIGFMTIGVVTSLCLRGGKETVEVRYYISSLAMDVKRFARAVRGHCSIDNRLSLGSRHDVSRGRVADPKQALRENFAWLNRFTLSLLKAASRPSEPRHETSQLWLERKIHAGSHYRRNGLVCAGPGSSASSATKRPSLSPGPEGFCARPGRSALQISVKPNFDPTDS